MPDSPEKPQKRRANRATGIIAFTFFAIVAAVFYSLARNQQHAADCQSAIANMRSLSCAFLEFDQEYGSFPEDETAKEVIESTGTEIKELTRKDRCGKLRREIAIAW